MISFVFLYNLTEFQENFSKNKGLKKLGVNTYEVKILGLILSFVITGINFILAIVIRKLAGYESLPTRTEYIISIAQKLTIAQFINTAILTFTIQFLSTQNYYGAG